MEINLARITDKVSDIKQALRVLREYAFYRDEDFLENDEAIRSARYCFIVLVEATTNIANHICAKILRKSPANYAESFLLLGGDQVISATLAGRLAKMTGFRNILVHGYGEVDDQRMLAIMRENLSDVDKFLEQIGLVLSEFLNGDRLMEYTEPYASPERRSITEGKKNALLVSLKALLQPYEEIEFVFVHGSFLEKLPFRDIDVAVQFEEQLTKDQVLDNCLELAANCSHELGFEVDVHALNHSSIAFRFHASQGELILARDEEKALDFREDSWARYFDFRPVLEQNLRDLLEPK